VKSGDGVIAPFRKVLSFSLGNGTMFYCCALLIYNACNSRNSQTPTWLRPCDYRTRFASLPFTVT